jgi:hypothetical protein
MSLRFVRASIVVSLLVAAAGCYSGSRPVSHVPPPPMPAAQAEVMPASPGPGYIWIPGHWTWRPSDRTYAWVPGHWTVPPSGGVWVPGHWESRADGYVWVDSHWRTR